jgi:tetratricopeptide (TPR) repeat protein
LRQLCKGLAAAHASGVVHRDIKPENIVLQRVRGRVDVVKILDFGISIILAKGEKATSSVSAGTPHYLAPELITGTPFDQRADIYAVGCTAYAMLVGQPPFNATGPEALSVVLGKHLTEQPIAPSWVRSQVTPAMDPVVLRCLAKSPEDRYRAMPELEAALCEAQIKAGLHTSWDDLPLPDDVDPDVRERLLRDMPDMLLGSQPRRRRWLLPVLTAAALAIGVGGTYLALAHAVSTASESSTDQIEALAAEAQAAAAKTYFVYPPSDDPNQVTAYTKIRELESLQGPGEAEALEQARALRAEFATTLVRLGDTYWERSGGKAFATDYYAQALVFDGTLVRAADRTAMTPQKLSELEAKAASQSFSKEEIIQAESLAAKAAREKKALRRREGQRPHGKEDPPVKPEGAAAVVTPAELASVTDAPSEGNAASLAKQALALLANGKTGEAEQAFGRALAIDPANRAALGGMFDISFNRGDYKKALAHAKKLVNAAPGDGGSYVKLGDARFKLGDFQAARAHYARGEQLGAAGAAARLRKAEAKLLPPSAPEEVEEVDEEEPEEPDAEADTPTSEPAD